MNQQREVIYDMRLHALEGGDLHDETLRMIGEVVATTCAAHLDDGVPREDWNVRGLASEIESLILAPAPLPEGNGARAQAAGTDLAEYFAEVARAAWNRREIDWAPEIVREVERRALVHVIDEKWKDHLYELDQMKAGIGLRGYGQKDPLLEYKKEAFAMFQALLADINSEVVKLLFRAQVQVEQPGAQPTPAPAREHAGVAAAETRPAPAAPQAPLRVTGAGVPLAAPRRGPQPYSATHAALSGFAASGGARPASAPALAPVHAGPKLGRNDPCSCGSGKKYKKCHGATT
jgi:preprotein translocase subunit SecA